MCVDGTVVFFCSPNQMYHVPCGERGLVFLSCCFELARRVAFRACLVLRFLHFISVAGVEVANENGCKLSRMSAGRYRAILWLSLYTWRYKQETEQ